MVIQFFFDPFFVHGFMCRGILACCFLSISITPIGGLLMFRKMSLMGDALSHAILPGIAIGYFFSGVSFIVMSIGGFFSGALAAVLSNWVSEKTTLKQDAGLSGFYLGFLALGVVLLSFKRSNLDLLNLLFGSVLSVDIVNLKYIFIVSIITLFFFVLFCRVLVIDTFDSDFLRINNFRFLRFVKVTFLLIVVLNLMASLQVIGALMSIGLMMLPALCARYWVKGLINVLLLSIFIAIICSWIGLLSAFYFSIPAGPAIVLCISILFFISVFFGKNKGIIFSVM